MEWDLPYFREITGRRYFESWPELSLISVKIHMHVISRKYG